MSLEKDKDLFMKVIFYGNEAGNWIDKLIRWWTSSTMDKFNGMWKDSYSHVELLFEDGLMFSASQYENSTRFKPYNHESTSWTHIYLPTAQEPMIREFCELEAGKKYDYLGVAGFVIGVRDHSSKWFCSEICTEALIVSGCLGRIDSAKVSPNDLFKILTKRKTPCQQM